MSKRMRLVVNRWVAAMAVALLWCMPMKAELKAGGEYYIWLNIYEKLLWSDSTGTAPVLSAFDVNENKNGYVFVADSLGKSGYVLLKHKSSGKYLAASSSNAWSVTLESKPTDDRFWWKADEGCYVYLINKKSNTYLGIDGANKGSTYVSVYYDKPKGSHSQFTIIPANGSWEETRQAYVSAEYTNAQGVKEIDYCQLNNKNINRSDAIDIHITSNDEPMLGTSTVNLGSDRTWLIFDNIVPSKVISTYLQYVKINGAPAVNKENCRVAIYLNGAAVIPIPSVVMSCEGLKGSFTLDVRNHTDLSKEDAKQSNTMTKFTLRRGYMATLAAGTYGSNHSRVYVADHADLTVTLPEALAKRVSSVYIKPWQYLSKKGWGNTAGESGGPGLRATWYWSWSAGYSSTPDMEYVPCRQHKYWPGTDEVNSHTSTASLSLNEPEHSEQHTSEKCTCGGTIDEWTAYSDYNSTFQAGGGRIGSPQPTDFSYLTNYFGFVDKNNQSRCDFAVTHAYWDLGGRDEAGYADWFCNTQCSNIWKNTGRPVWLTEMEISASWNSNKVTSYEQNRKYLQVLLQKIDECPWIERYAIYGVDMWQTYMYYEANPSKGLTPAGQVYRDHRATFAYNKNYTKEPVWWKPSVKKPKVTYEVNPEEKTITFTISETNGDVAQTVTLEYKPEGGDWQQIAVFGEDRNELDNDIVYTTKLNMEGGKFRAKATTIFGGSATGDETIGPVIADIEQLYYCVKNRKIGFGRGEYATYNNREGIKCVEEALAINHYDADLHAKVVAACKKIESVTWTPNTEELDAVYDGTFAHAKNNGAPAGWRMTNNTLGGEYHSRAFVGDSRLSEFNNTKSAFFMRFDGTNSNRGSMYYYGDTEGYTMPLKANAEYRLVVDFAGWNSVGKPLRLNVAGPSGFEAVSQQYNTTFKADKEDKEPQHFEITFTTTSAGNYVFYFQTPGSDDNAHMVVVSNISLKRIVGDVDGSGGEPDVEDVKALVKRVLGQMPDGFVESAADIDGDGVVDISDVTKLIEKLLSSQ